MSIDRNIYVGPIVRCKFPKGSRIYTLSDEDRGFELFSASDEDDGGRSFPKGEHVYVTNFTKKSQPRPFHLDDEASHFTVLGGDLPERETEWFLREFATSIAMLVKTYGQANVRVEWAILRWSS